jgi:glycosyltransferase involved in cell wall biosynthesis
MTRIALFAPISPLRSALVDHIQGLLPYLARSFDTVLVTDGSYTPRHPLLAADAEPRIQHIDYAAFQTKPDAFDLVIYQLGDEANLHGYMFDALHRYPGLVFLHDLVVHHAIVERTLNSGNPEAYVAEMRYCYGEQGEILAREVMSGQGGTIMDRYPLVNRILDDSLAVVAFNGHMVDRIHEICPNLPVYQIPYAFYLPDGVSDGGESETLRRELGLADRPIVASFGLFNSQKRLLIALRAFRRLLHRQPDAIYLLVGAPQQQGELEQTITTLGLAGRVRPTGWLDSAEFCRYMLIADVALQLRFPHVGGTPYTPTRLLGLGVPTIVSDIAPLDDWPDDVMIRIPPETAEEEPLILAALDYLLAHPDVARALGQRARHYVHEERKMADIASRYIAAINETVAQREALRERAIRRSRPFHAAPSDPRQEGLVRVAGQALAELGVSSLSPSLLHPVAQAIHHLTAE